MGPTTDEVTTEELTATLRSAGASTCPAISMRSAIVFVRDG